MKMGDPRIEGNVGDTSEEEDGDYIGTVEHS